MLLISGPPQSGKSLLASSVTAADARRHVTVYVTDQLDTKALLGNYVCGETVGEFEWKEGPLSSIVKHGGILVLENFQEAKDEMVELISDVINDRFKVKGERVHVKDSFRVICVFSIQNQENLEKLGDLKREISQIGEITKTSVTINDLMQQYKILSSNTLMAAILNDLFNIVTDLNKDLKSELKSTIIEAASFLNRVNHLFTKTFKGENPIHFSINFKYCIGHLFNDIYLSKFRNQVPDGLLDRMGNAFKITGSELRAYFDSYKADLSITESTVSSKRYGTFHREEPETLFNPSSSTNQGKRANPNFFATSLVANLAEAVLGSCKFGNQMLLVGEAGSGKTTIVQETAGLLGKVLHVYNMSQSSDVSDLIGGFKPLNAKTYISETADEFCSLLRDHFDYEKNIKLISYLKQLLAGDKTTLALMYMARETSNIISACDKHLKSLEEGTQDFRTFSKKHKAFRKFGQRLTSTLKLRDRLESSLIFKFIQGNLVSALRQGQWILLDEINLAQPEVLQQILPILENKSIILIEKGEIKEIRRHPDFKLFGCMNPGNTVGKKELPPLIRKNFVEYFVKELDDASEIMTIIKNRSKCQFQEMEYQRITQLYLRLREQVNKHQITDGFNRKPTISLRGLSRAIDIALVSWQYYPSQRNRAVIEGLYAAFSSNLGVESKKVFAGLMCETFQIDINFLPKAELGSANTEKPGFINIEGFLLKKGSVQIKTTDQTDFLLTGSVKNHLVELLRVLAHSSYPILLEGPTSAGKTSMIKYLGERSGNKVVRINNHQHTDLDEYVGTYSPDERGRLVFKEGLLVEAMRNGYWIILDELNLARSEILEALNRLLDDNRELYIPEINQVIVPHSDFRIFATQNPLDYAGRKELSVAFRSRFFHFFVGDIADDDLVSIVETRCQVPRSRSAKLVEIMKHLRVLRSRQNVSAGKESLITIRDLLKWAAREVVELELMAVNGYCLLAERLRYESEREQVKAVLQKLCLKQEQVLDPPKYYQDYYKQSVQRLEISQETLSSVFWSESFIRMYSLVMMGIEKGEPVLLIGETGCGKTTIAELVAKIFGTQLYTINCHQYTESSDFLGGLRPTRGKDKIIERVRLLIKELIADFGFPEAIIKELKNIDEKIDSEERTFAWEVCFKLLKEHFDGEGSSSDSRERVMPLFTDIKTDLDKIGQLFEWVDGPLIQAMTHGGVLLIDEISLAQDSVLERLNSVLEKEKTIMISEKGDGTIQEITAHANFKIIGTMNPSGDYGKKELTPALRNRFTEIWVEPITSLAVLEQDLDKIENITTKEMISHVYEVKNDLINFLLKELQSLETKTDLTESSLAPESARAITSLFIHNITLHFNKVYGMVLKPLTIRDIKSSLPFILKNIKNYDDLGVKLFKDYISILLGGFKCLDKAVASSAIDAAGKSAELLCSKLLPAKMNSELIEVCQESEIEFSIGDYSILKQIVGHTYEDPKYSINEDVVKQNLKTILMALTLDKAIMLEGPPGVGKTSLIQFLAHKVGIKFYRVNLNEQTDMIDLLGSDVPSSSSSVFSWADGVLIQAMKQGAWILLDELNMATQTVLEGLNSILDHRGSIYLPELDQTIHKHPRFRIFASQNPMSMGSGRKGLPHSFLTRFTRVWIEELSRESLQDIIRRVYKNQLAVIPNLETLVELFFEVKTFLQSSEAHQLSDSHWEFNLRDLHKMIEFIEIDLSKQISDSNEITNTLPLIEKACNLIVMARLDSPTLKLKIEQMFRKTFSGTAFTNNLDILSKGRLSLPQHLYHGNLTKLNNLVEEPLLNLLDTVVESGHPLLFLYDSRSDASFINLESLVTNLGRPRNISQIKKVSLFNSSDIIDLIGSYEQVVPTEDHQRRAADNLFNSLTSELKMPTQEQVLQCFAQTTRADSLFSWKDSELCSAIRQGHWVVLKGAELVNPAILERLNGLLEEKEIFINEAIGTGKDIETVVKDENFRIFILYDKSKAKQAPSRALRNRCIEINLNNFEVFMPVKQDAKQATNDICNFQDLQKVATHHALFPLDSNDQVLMECERYLILDRLIASINLFKGTFDNFLSNYDFSSVEPAQNFIKTVAFLVKTVQRRGNFNFDRKRAKKAQPIVDQQSFKDFVSSGETVTPMLETFVSNFTNGKKFSAFDSQVVKKLWSEACQSLSTDDESVEESLRILDETEDRSLKVLTAYWILACKNSKKTSNWIKPLEVIASKTKSKMNTEMLLDRDFKALPENERSVHLSGGFVSPLNLCLNALFGHLISKSEGYSGMLDKSTESKLKKGPSNPTWLKICKIFEKGQILKSSIVNREFSDSDLIKKLADVIKITLTRNVSVEETSLSTFLDLISDSVEASFSQIIESVSEQFIDYDMLDEVTNLTNHRYVFKPKATGIYSFIAFLSRAAEIEQIFLPDRVLKLANHCTEVFERVRELDFITMQLFQQMKVSREQLPHLSLKDDTPSTVPTSLDSYLDLLSDYYKVAPRSTKAIHQLMREGRRRTTIRLAGLISQLNHKEYKVCDYDCIAALDSKLSKLSSEAQNDSNQDFKDLEASISLPLTEDGKIDCSNSLKLLRLICNYAENPNHNTVLSLLESLASIVESEVIVNQEKHTSLINRRYESIFNHSDKLRKIHEQLTSIGRQLKSQKTRQISKHHFETEEGVSQENHKTLSFFVSQILFRILHKNTCFLADSDVQEMKRLLSFANNLEENWLTTDFSELQTAIGDTYRQLQSFINNGQIITFGDCLLPYFGGLSEILFSALHWKLANPNQWPQSPSDYASVDDITQLRSLLQSADLSLGASEYLGLRKKATATQNVAETRLLASAAQLAKETAIGRGRSIDEASRLKNLAKGVERTVRDEYTKEAVEEQKADEKFEILKTFGVEADIVDDPRYKEAYKHDLVRAERKEFVKLVVDGVFMYPKDGGVAQGKNRDMLERAFFDIVAKSDSNLLDIRNLNEVGLLRYYTQIMRKDLLRETETSGQRDARKTLMMEQKGDLTLEEFERFWLAQMKQFIELEETSFYKGKCVADLIKLRPIIFELLDKVQELRLDVDLRELPSFNNIISVADHLLSLVLKKATLNEVCLLLEKLSDYVKDYESITPRKFHFPEIKEKLRESLYGFRQVERKSWRGLIFCQGLDQILLDIDECIVVKNVILDEVITIEPDETVNASRERKLLDLVDHFLTKTSLLKQLFRMFWLLRVLRQLPSTVTLPTFKKLALHLLRYHLSFLPTLIKVYCSNFEAVGEPIKANEKLSNWHMKDLDNLRSNVTKFHKGVQRSIKLHKDVLEISVEGQVYRHRRDGYLSKDAESAKKAIDEQIAVKVKEEDKEKQDKEEKAAKVLGKGTIDRITGKAEFQGPGIERIVKSNIKLCRLVKPEEWLPYFGEKSSKYSYKNYESSIDQCLSFISDWMATLEGVKDVQSKSNRLRVLDGFLKTLLSMGIKDRQTIENWDPLKLFAFCPNPIDAGEVQEPHHKETLKKMFSRSYEMVDMLYISKANVSYSPDLQANIRRKIQGFMINLAAANMDMLKKFSKAIRLINSIVLSIKVDPIAGLGLLADRDRARFESEFAKYSKINDRISNLGFSGTKKMINDKKIFAEFEAFKNKNIDLGTLNANLYSLNYTKPFAKKTDEQTSKYESKFATTLTKFQTQLSKDVSNYDILTKSKLFLLSQPAFMAALPGHLSALKSLTCGHRDANVNGQLLALLTCLQSHLVQAADGSTKFEWMSFRVLHNLIYSGLCVAKDEDEAKGEEGETEYDMGTGIGEGKGDENATEKYEFQEQVLGEKDKGGEDEDDDADGDDDEDGGEDEDKEGGKSMSVDHEDKGMDDRKDEKEKEEKDEEQEMSEVDDGDVENDLWDKENEDMDEDSQQSEDRREDENREFQDKEPLDQGEKEQKAKEPTDKEQRQANDYEEQEANKGQEEQSDAEVEADKDEEEGDENEDEFAEVESRSEMSERNDNDNMDFDKEQEEKDGQEENDEENPDFDLEDNLNEENQDDKDEEKEAEEFEDPLNKKEKKIQEDDENENAGEQDENQENVKNAGLNPEVAEETQNKEKKNEENPLNEKEKNTKKGSGNEKKTKKEDPKETPVEEAKDKMDEEHPEKEDNSKDAKNQEAKHEGKTAPEDESRPQPKDLNIPKDKLASILEQMLMADDDEEQDEGDEIEGLAEGGDVEMRVKKSLADKKHQAHQKRSDENRVDATNARDDREVNDKDEADKRSDGDDQEVDDKDGKNEKDQEATSEVQEEGDLMDLPQKKLKQEELEEIEERHLVSMEDVNTYLNLLTDNEHHLSSTNNQWSVIEPSLRTKAYNLCEELRNIFKPTKIAGLKGDFRTGKRLNMRKVISYVASNYRKDKIWLRRSDPSQRDYEIALAIDDTLSMSEKNVGYLALESLIILALSLSKLEVGKLNISGVRSGLHEVLPFSKPFTPSEGQKILDNFTFTHSDQHSADLGLPAFLMGILEKFTPGHQGRLLLLLNDGRCNKDLVRPVIRQLENEGVIVVNIILDKKAEKASVLNIRSTTFETIGGVRKPKVTQYMEDYPFSRYIIVQDTSELVSVLVSVLRETIEP
jgi:MoxR-like ATPase